MSLHFTDDLASEDAVCGRAWARRTDDPTHPHINCFRCEDILAARAMRCRIWRDGNGWWEWRCPACSTDYEFGGGGREWWTALYAVHLHVATKHPSPNAHVRPVIAHKRSRTIRNTPPPQGL